LSRLPRHLRGWLLAPVFVLFVAAGCQEDQPSSLGPSRLLWQEGEAARFLPADPCVDPVAEAKLLKQMVAAINAERAKHRLAPVKADPTLGQIADFYACRLVEGAFFAHVDPYDGSTVSTRAADFGYAFRKVGENLAAEQRTVEQVMADWMRSPSHRANILDPAFTHVGIAVKGGGALGPYWVQEFGRPITASPLPLSVTATTRPSSSTPTTQTAPRP